jgi:hypothetical protein
VVFRSEGLGEDELYQVKHVHEGPCHDRAEAELVGDRGAPWRELTDHLNEVVTSTGLTFDRLVMKEVGWLSLHLTPDQYAAIEGRLAAVTQLLKEYGLASPFWDGPRSDDGGKAEPGAAPDRGGK